MIRIKHYTVYQAQGRQEDILAKTTIFRNNNDTVSDAFFCMIFNSSENSFLEEESPLGSSVFEILKSRNTTRYCSPICFKININVSTKNITSLFL